MDIDGFRLVLMYIHRSFFAQAIIEHPVNRPMRTHRTERERVESRRQQEP
jgi:hypothetical protein